MNPRLLSNNFQLVYAIAVWEEFFKKSFYAIAKNATDRRGFFKKIKLSSDKIEKIAAGEISVEEAISQSLSFQRPSQIVGNFKKIDSKLSLSGSFQKPFKGRKKSLLESIEELVEGRNAFVHEGALNMGLYDKELQKALVDMKEVVNRSYSLFGRFYKFDPISDY